MQFTDYYTILEIGIDASMEDVKRAFRRHSMRYHPDRNKSSDAPNQFRVGVEANEILSNGDKRTQYDYIRQKFLETDISQIDLEMLLRWQEDASKKVSQFSRAPAWCFGSDELVGCLEKDLEWLDREAANGNPKAQLALAFHHGKLEDDPRHLREAAKWTLAAAEAGDAEGMYAAGTLYETAGGVPKDNSKAFALYLQAAKKGVADAQYSTGKGLVVGRGTDANPELGAEWLAKACEADLCDALYYYGLLLLTGQSIEQDKERGVALLERATELGSSDAEFVLAGWYRTEASLNLPRAYQLLLSAAEKGHAGAQFEHARLLKKDRAKGPLHVEMYGWISKAAAQGHQDAMDLKGAIDSQLKIHKAGSIEDVPSHADFERIITTRPRRFGIFS